MWIFFLCSYGYVDCCRAIFVNLFHSLFSRCELLPVSQFYTFFTLVFFYVPPHHQGHFNMWQWTEYIYDLFVARERKTAADYFFYIVLINFKLFFMCNFSVCGLFNFIVSLFKILEFFFSNLKWRIWCVFLRNLNLNRKFYLCDDIRFFRILI